MDVDGINADGIIPMSSLPVHGVSESDRPMICNDMVCVD